MDESVFVPTTSTPTVSGLSLILGKCGCAGQTFDDFSLLGCELLKRFESTFFAARASLLFVHVKYFFRAKLIHLRERFPRVT